MTLLKSAPGFSGGNKSGMRQRWEKNTNWQSHRLRGGRVEAYLGSSVFEFGFQLDCHMYTYTVHPTCTQLRLAPNLPEPNYCLYRETSSYFLSVFCGVIKVSNVG